MFVSSAKTKCPDLVILPYDFDAYKKKSKQFYDLLVSLNVPITVGSMDEAYLDFSGLDYVDIVNYCTDLKNRLFHVLQITCSFGYSLD
jgi:nucleotidyltransferase/DNA polymerase involved in DNA repair